MLDWSTHYVGLYIKEITEEAPEKLREVQALEEAGMQTQIQS